MTEPATIAENANVWGDDVWNRMYQFVFRSPLVVIFEVHPTLRRILTIQCPQRLEHVEVLKVPNLEKEDVTMVSVQSSRAILVE